MKFFNKMHGKTTDIHQENCVAFANLADLTNVDLPIIYRPNKYVHFFINLAGLLVSLFCALLGLLFIPVLMTKTPDGYGYLFGVVLAVGCAITTYLFGQKLLSIRYPYTFAIYDDGVEFVGNAFKSKLDFIGFDRAYLAEYTWSAHHAQMYLYYVSFSDDGTEYRTHRRSIVHFSSYQTDIAHWTQIVNALIVQYQKTHQIHNLPKVKFIAQQ